MYQIFFTTLKGVARDKIYKGLLLTATAYFAIPLISIFSLRQVTALAITLSLSLTSFILLLLSVFLGGTSLWKEIERKYVHSALAMPISRGSYLLGKYLGVCGFIFLTATFLGIMCAGSIWFTATAYPPENDILWQNIILSIFFFTGNYLNLFPSASSSIN